MLYPIQLLPLIAYGRIRAIVVDLIDTTHISYPILSFPLLPYLLEFYTIPYQPIESNTKSPLEINLRGFIAAAVYCLLTAQSPLCHIAHKFPNAILCYILQLFNVS